MSCHRGWEAESACQHAFNAVLFDTEVSKFNAIRLALNKMVIFEISFDHGSFVKLVFVKGQIVKNCGKFPAEPKICSFGWLILHHKTLTAQNLLRRHWPCNWIYCLCTCAFEDTNHMFCDCVFAREVWTLIHTWQTLSVPSIQPGDISSWWDKSIETA
jgi:hypothetical protein